MHTKVYSDVDDTLQCSHEHNGAGVDTQLPSKTIYPGAVAFELALSRGVNNAPALPVVLLSARPRVQISFYSFTHARPPEGTLSVAVMCYCTIV
jgi:hypothetical protein